MTSVNNTVSRPGSTVEVVLSVLCTPYSYIYTYGVHNKSTVRPYLWKVPPTSPAHFLLLLLYPTYAVRIIIILSLLIHTPPLLLAQQSSLRRHREMPTLATSNGNSPSPRRPSAASRATAPSVMTMNGHFAGLGDASTKEQYEHGIQVIDEEKEFKYAPRSPLPGLRS